MSLQSEEPWWTRKEGEVHQTLIGFVRTLRSQQSTRYQNFQRFVNVYENGYVHGYAGNEAATMGTIDETKLVMNAAQNIIDTMHSQIYANPVIPMAITQGGDYSQRKRARMLNRALDGVYHECNVQKEMADSGLDALLNGCGIVKVWPEGGQVKVARIDPMNILIDDAEGRNRTPRCIYETGVVDRYQCAARYPKHREAILRAPVSNRDDYYLEFNRDQIDFVEAFHLKSGEDEDDGKHIISVEGADLDWEPWDDLVFPYAVNRPKLARHGWWGLAIMRQLLAGQYEFERVTLRLSEQHKKLGTTQIFVPESSDLTERDIDNEVGKVIAYSGNIKPEAIPYTPAHPQTYQYRSMLPQEMAQFVGTNEFSVQQQVPEGLKNASGKALTVFKDEGAKRYATYYKAVEDCTLQVADLIVKCVRKLMKDNTGMKVRFAKRNGYEQIEWKDILGAEDDEKSFILRVYPISALSQDPAVRFQQLDVLLNIGLITPRKFGKLSNIPDTEAENELASADEDVIEWSLDKMVSDGVYVPPNSYDDLELAAEMAGDFMNMCRTNGVSEGRMKLVEDYIIEVKALMTAARGPAGPAMGPGMPPGAPPGMPPGMPPGAPPMGQPGPEGMMPPPDGGMPPMPPPGGPPGMPPGPPPMM